MSLKDILLTVLIIAFLTVAWKANAYRNDAISAELKLEVSQKELRIEKDNPLIKKNVEEIVKLNKELNNKNKELVILYNDLRKVQNIKNTRTEIMEGLDVEDTESICNELADMGYPICDNIE